MDLSNTMHTYVEFYGITKDELKRQLRERLVFLDLTFEQWWEGKRAPKKNTTRRLFEKFFNPFLWENYGERLEFPAIRSGKRRKRGTGIRLAQSPRKLYLF